MCQNYKMGLGVVTMIIRANFTDNNHKRKREKENQVILAVENVEVMVYMVEDTEDTVEVEVVAEEMGVVDATSEIVVNTSKLNAAHVHYMAHIPIPSHISR